jgi:hypothetical protein
MKRRIRFDSSTAALYPLMLGAFRDGANQLGPGNPENGNRDLRPGDNGAAVVRGERAVIRAMRAIGRERPLTEDEEVGLVTAFQQAKGREATEAEIAAFEKPFELAPVEDGKSVDLVLSETEYARLVAYCDAARWTCGCEQAVDMLDMIANAEKVAE